MNEHWTRYGRQRLADALTNGEPLAIVGDQLGKEFASPAGVAAFGGYISAALETLDRLRGAGFKFSGDALLEMPSQGAALRLNGIIARSEWDGPGDARRRAAIRPGRLPPLAGCSPARPAACARQGAGAGAAEGGNSRHAGPPDVDGNSTRRRRKHRELGTDRAGRLAGAMIATENASGDLDLLIPGA